MKWIKRFIHLFKRNTILDAEGNIDNQRLIQALKKGCKNGRLYG